MKSNYDILGNHIRLVDTRNKDLVSEQVLGINIDKFFMPSVANVIGTDLSKYKLITKGKFACNPMHVGRDERLPVALYSEDTPAIVSPAYFMFEIMDSSVLNEEYLMMWFRRPEFDRLCWLRTDGSVRGGITWDDICRMEVPVPPMDEQMETVNSYKAITKRIALKKQINDNLANASNVTSSGFNFDTCMFVTEEKDKAMNKGHLSAFDIILTSRGTLGNVALYDNNIPYKNVRINSGMLIMRPKTERISAYFIYALLKSGYMKIAIEQFRSGSAQPQLPIKDLQKISFDIPDNDTILKTADKQFQALEETISKNKCEIDKLKALSSVLLAELSR